MTTIDRLTKNISIVLGLISAAFFVFDGFVFSSLQPKMIRFESVPPAEEGLLNWVGIGWLCFLAFCLLSLFGLARHLRKASKITPRLLILVACGVLSFLFIFADVILIGDIGKQYHAGLGQPEWSILFPMLGFQLMTAVVFTYFHLVGNKEEGHLRHVARDNNIFIVVQYVGIICGGLGLALSSMGFIYRRAWSLPVHTTMSLIILLFPYALAIIFWAITKIQEEKGQWYDEKQLQDTGKSAYLTLVLSVVLMAGIFIANYNDLGGVVRMLWFPLYLYFVVLFFSAGNLYFYGKE